MAARGKENILKCIALLDLLSSTSSSDEDEFFDTKERRKIPKIQNFLEVVHNLTDNEVCIHNCRLCIYININNSVLNNCCSSKVTFDYREERLMESLICTKIRHSILRIVPMVAVSLLQLNWTFCLLCGKIYIIRLYL